MSDITTNSIIQAHIDSVHSSGRCISVIDGKKYFIENVIPGEIVNICVSKGRNKFRKGIIDKIVTPSQHRRPVLCKHAGLCGGCNWMHIDYRYQLELKRTILLDALQKYEVETPKCPALIPSQNELTYRNKLTYRTGISSDSKKPEWILCFNQAEDRALFVEIDNCLIPFQASESLKQIVFNCLKIIPANEENRFIKEISIRTTTNGDSMLIFGISPLTVNEYLSFFLSEVIKVTKNNTSVYIYNSSEIKPVFIHHEETPEFIFEEFGGMRFRFGPSSFIQPNPVQADNIYTLLQSFAMFAGNETVIDLYCGSGAISLIAANNASKVTGIDGNGLAIADAIQNAVINNVDNAHFICGDVLQTFNHDFVKNYGKPDIIILDPPRSGTLIETVKVILFARPRKIIYLSCNPVSLAWNLRQLGEKYRVTAIQPFDMFPQTHHVETLALLELL